MNENLFDNSHIQKLVAKVQDYEISGMRNKKRTILIEIAADTILSLQKSIENNKEPLMAIFKE